MATVQSPFEQRFRLSNIPWSTYVTFSDELGPRHESAVRGRMDIDLELDPPSDLALKIDISRSSLNRLAIYADLRVPELWSWDGEILKVFW